MGIFCDAGFESISIDLALHYFSKDNISNWFRCACGFGDEDNDISDNDISDNLLATELGISVPNWDDDVEVEAWNDAIENFDFLPRKTPISVVTAKAVCGEEKWFSIVSLAFSGNRAPGSEFAKYEYQAILLGVKMRDCLNLDLPIVNDSKDAVKIAKQEFSNIQWARRSVVSCAHNLKIANATKIIPN
jgi:hypothetical protein